MIGGRNEKWINRETKEIFKKLIWEIRKNLENHLRETGKNRDTKETRNKKNNQATSVKV